MQFTKVQTVKSVAIVRAKVVGSRGTATCCPTKRAESYNTVCKKAEGTRGIFVPRAKAYLDKSAEEKLFVLKTVKLDFIKNRKV